PIITIKPTPAPVATPQAVITKQVIIQSGDAAKIKSLESRLNYTSDIISNLRNEILSLRTDYDRLKNQAPVVSTFVPQPVSAPFSVANPNAPSGWQLGLSLQTLTADRATVTSLTGGSAGITTLNVTGGSTLASATITSATILGV
ncbi:hypothetical protein KW791_03770, partial [Candidatus Parcubacteria bacterium]|nr:hypothetical protein [Candidatus Parcubacteria bacterium]